LVAPSLLQATNACERTEEDVVAVTTVERLVVKRSGRTKPANSVESTLVPDSLLADEQQKYIVDPKVDLNLVYVKVIKSASSTSGGIARRICVYFGLNLCTKQVFPHSSATKAGTEPGLWANHAPYHRLKGKITHLKKASFLFTFIREPAKRAMSYYYHFIATRHSRTFFDGVQNVTVKRGTTHPGEKLEKIKKQSNFQYHYLCQPKKGGWSEGGQDVAGCVDQYDFIGTAERYDESLVLLRHKLIQKLGGEDVPLSTFWYVSAKVATDGGGRGDGAGYKQVHHIPADQEPQALQDYIADEFPAANDLDYGIITRVNKHLDDAVAKIGRTQFDQELSLLTAQLKIVKQVCGVHADSTKMVCYWNDNGCNYKCLDQVAVELEGKDVFAMTEQPNHPDLIALIELVKTSGTAFINKKKQNRAAKKGRKAVADLNLVGMIQSRATKS
jgi:hypothetical protein